MTDPLTLSVAAVSLAVAGAAAWLHLPRPPALDGERWFKVMLATLLRGRIEADGGGVDRWEAAVTQFVPYHPAARPVDRLLISPQSRSVVGVAGERTLMATLAELPPGIERWKRLFSDPAGLDAVLDDPYELGRNYDLATWLGPDGTWDALAAWGGAGSGFSETLWRRAPKFIVWSDRPAGLTLVPALLAVLGDHGRVVSSPETLLTALGEWLTDASQPFVLVAEGWAFAEAFRFVDEQPLWRDRMAAFVAVGAPIRGIPDLVGDEGATIRAEWLAARFSHVALDTEANRTTPYFALGWSPPSAETPGEGEIPLGHMFFPEPAGGPGASSIAAIPLGVLPDVPDLPLDQVAKALVTLVVAWNHSQR